MPTALVTGASYGLGLAIAREFASRKYDLILVARGHEALAKVAAELQSTGVRVETVAADLTDSVGLRAVETLVSERQVDVLVNNAGYGHYGKLWEVAPDDSEGEVRLNVIALVRLTRAALPHMIERGVGTIINIASTASFQPVPYFATYGGTKAFVLSFSEAVAAELRGSGVRGVGVVAVCPGPMETGFQRRAGAGKSTYGLLPWEDPVMVARKTADLAETPQPVAITSLFSRIMVFANRLTPRWLVTWIAERMFRPRLKTGGSDALSGIR